MIVIIKLQCRKERMYLMGFSQGEVKHRKLLVKKPPVLYAVQDEKLLVLTSQVNSTVQLFNQQEFDMFKRFQILLPQTHIVQTDQHHLQLVEVGLFLCCRQSDLFNIILNLWGSDVLICGQTALPNQHIMH